MSTVFYVCCSSPPEDIHAKFSLDCNHLFKIIECHSFYTEVKLDLCRSFIVGCTAEQMSRLLFGVKLLALHV